MDELKQTRNEIVQENYMAKRLKLDFESTSNTTILDMNDDCLSEIFRFLDIKDLLNVRAANSKFKISTEMTYLRIQRGNTATIVTNENDVNLEHSVDILKQFGHLIKNLFVSFKMDKFDLLMQAIVKYCGDTVNKLKFSHANDEWYFGLHRTGVRRTKRQLRELRTKFPKLLSLTFDYNDGIIGCPYSDDIIQAIPTLAAFSACGIIFSHEDVVQFIGLNSQLEHLKLWVPNGFITQSFIDTVDVSLPDLKSLTLNRVTIEGPLKSPTMHSTRFPNLRKLVFGNIYSAYSVDGLAPLFGTEIEELELFSENYFIANFIGSVSRFKKLTKFTINLVEHSRPLERRIVHPSSDEFDMSIVSSNAIKEIILSNSQLKKIMVNWHHQPNDFHVHERKYRQVFEQKLNGAQWLVHVQQFRENVQSMGVIFGMQK